MAEYRLPEQKYTEAEYLFQTIEMAKSDEEYDLCSSSPPPRRTDLIADLDLVQQEPSIFSWKVVKRRSRRRYTISHHVGGTPPAPPSTPTSLTATATPTPSPTANSINMNTNCTSSSSSSGCSSSTTNAMVASAAVSAADADERLNNLLYILDYVPKYKKKLKEQQRTDAELAALLNVITLTNGNGSGNAGSSSSSSGANAVGMGGGSLANGHQPLEHRICSASRTIRKPASSTKIFKIHRNPKWFFREPDLEEDSVSAPEYDDAEERENNHSALRYRRQLKRRSLLVALRQRRFARFEQQERMETMMHDFGSAMTFNEV